MQKIVSANYKLTRFTLPRDEAIALMKEKGETYKVLLMGTYTGRRGKFLLLSGEFIDLCAGPHLYSTGLVKAFKLTSLTGAYWEGDSK